MKRYTKAFLRHTLAWKNMQNIEFLNKSENGIEIRRNSDYNFHLVIEVMSG